MTTCAVCWRTSSQPQRASTSRSPEEPSWLGLGALPLPSQPGLGRCSSCVTPMWPMHIWTLHVNPAHVRHIHFSCPVPGFCSWVGSAHVSCTCVACAYMSWTLIQVVPFWARPLLRPPKKGERPVIDTSFSPPPFPFPWSSRSSLRAGTLSNTSVRSSLVPGTHKELNKCLLVKIAHLSAPHSNLLFLGSGE